MAINRHHEKRKFSEHNDTAVFDKDFNILYCDDKKLFHRIAVAHDRISEKLITTPDGESIIHFFLYRGRYHRARIDKFGDGNILCRVSKEILEEELSNEELFEYIDEIAHHSLNVLSMSDAIENYYDMSRYSSDDFHKACNIQRKEVLNVYNRSQAIIRALLNNDNDDFIPLHKYILRTWDIMQFTTKKFPKTVEMYIDTVFPAIRINYSKLEFVLYNLVKLALIYSTGPKEPLISIRAVDCDHLGIETNFRLNTEFKLINCSFEMHVIKHIFRLMNGHFEIYAENNTLYAKGSLRIESSCRAEDITPGRDLKFIGDSELLERKKNSENYLRIYKKIPAKNDMLASSTVDFSDVVEEDVKFAEMFFADILTEE